MAENLNQNIETSELKKAFKKISFGFIVKINTFSPKLQQKMHLQKVKALSL